MECGLGNAENVDNMLMFWSALLTNQTKVALKASIFKEPDHKCLMMRQRFYLSFPTSSEINVLSDMAVTANLAVLGTSLYFCFKFQTI